MGSEACEKEEEGVGKASAQQGTVGESATSSVCCLKMDHEQENPRKTKMHEFKKRENARVQKKERMHEFKEEKAHEFEEKAHKFEKK